MSKVIGFVCGTADLDLSMGDTIVVYPSIEELKKARKCVEECGIIEVTFGEVVQQPMSLEEIIKRERDNNNK